MGDDRPARVGGGRDSPRIIAILLDINQDPRRRHAARRPAHLAVRGSERTNESSSTLSQRSYHKKLGFTVKSIEITSIGAQRGGDVQCWQKRTSARRRPSGAGRSQTVELTILFPEG